MQPMLLTIHDVARLLQIKPSTLYAWAAHGKIPALKIHGLVRFRAAEITTWVESFRNPRRSRKRPHGTSNHSGADLHTIIARAQSPAYNPRPRGNQPKSSPIGKEETDGAV